MKILILIFFIQNQNIGEVWNWISNDGRLGGHLSMNLQGLSWPGNDTINNYYLYRASFIVGAKDNGIICVRNSYLTENEWGYGLVYYEGPGVSDWDIIITWHDSLTNTRVPPGKHTGIAVICKSYTWSYEPWNDFIFYEFHLVWNKDQCDIPYVGEFLDSVFVGIYYNFDISGAAPPNAIKNTIISFDGYVAHEWPNYPYDSILLLPDSFLNIKDGIPDQYIVYGDDPLENTLYGNIIFLPRNLSYAFDPDGNSGFSEGYAGYALIYAPPSPADTFWIDSHGKESRIVRVWAHQIWSGENAPGVAEGWYAYMEGRHPATQNYRFAPSPIGLGEEIYEGLITSGPFKISDKETLRFVWVAGVGQKMNGGYDEVFGRGWIRGLRQTIDYALTAYYAGSQNSDPHHPSAPNEDIHYKLPPPGNIGEKKIIIPTIINSSFEIFLKRWKNIEIIDFTGKRLKKYRAIGRVRPFKDIKRGIYFLKIGNDKYKVIVIK